jgi:SAM-dependent methyltransferase
MCLFAESGLETRAVELILTLPALAETRRAFDGVASTYHRDNAANPLICAMRDRTLSWLTTRVPAGAALLDLGCGPGTDAVRLARQGYRVTAIDWSPVMAGEARARVAAGRLDGQVDVQTLGIHQLDRLAPAAFDAAYSDLGPFNCVADLPAAARAVARRLRPGGVFVASVMGRVCPWEVARYALSGDWRRAGIRFTRGFVPVPLEGRTVWTRYYRPSEFEATFAQAGFRTLALAALGLFTPPPYLQAFSARHPALVRGLERLEARTARWPGLRQCGDHFLVAMQKGEGR